MNNSEQLLSTFAEMFFYKEFVFDYLCFTPKWSTEIELADLLINLGDFIIAIQLKSRNQIDQTDDLDKEIKWLKKKCKNAKEQIKETLHLIYSGNIPSFKNKRGEDIELSPCAEVIPLVVFQNDKIQTYTHLLKKHTMNGINVSCMSFLDFQQMCRVLYTPIEIISYLKYRKELYEKYGEIDIMIFDRGKDGLIITKPTQNESLVYQFLSEQYGYEQAAQNSFFIKQFQEFLHLLPEHTIATSERNGVYELLLFLAHMNRVEINEFMKRFTETRDEAKSGLKGIKKSIRCANDEYAVLFVAGEMLPIDFLLKIVHQKVNVKRLWEVVIYWEDNENFRVDFYYINSFVS